MSRLVEQWAAGQEVDGGTAMDSTYTWGRQVTTRTVGADASDGRPRFGPLSVLIAGAGGSRLTQYAIMGAALGTAVQLIAVHSFTEAAMRPARVDIAGDTGIGDTLPRSRPTFAAWSNVCILATAFSFAVAGAMLAAVFASAAPVPVLTVAIGGALTLAYGVPITVGAAFSPSLQPIRDLAAGTGRARPGTPSDTGCPG